MNEKPNYIHFTKELHLQKKADNESLYKSLVNLCKQLELSIISELKHEFSPHGFTAVFILSESHIALHYWPENNFIHLDLICCKKDLTKEIFEKAVNNCFED